MAEKQFYWLKLKKDFFKRNDIQIIEGMPNGKDYILFYLKLLCESIDHEGNLRFSDEVPYNENMLSVITNTNVDIVRSAVKIFTELKMMDIMDDGTYFMREVEKMIGSAKQDDNTRESTRLRVEAYRKRQKQNKLSEPQKRYSNVTCNGEIEIDIDKELRVNNNIAETDVSAQKPKLNPDDHDFWRFAKDNAELAEAFYRTTGIVPVKSQFGRWVKDLRDLAEAGINAEQLRKTINYMQTEGIQISAPGSCLKTAQWLKSRGSVPVRSQSKQKPAYNAFEQLAMQMNGIQEPSWDVEL